MRILLSNDDGYFAPGLVCLAEQLATIAEVTVVAPERDYSGASNSLTLDRPLAVKKIRERFYTVNGTPTDCVHLAVTGLLDELPDMVIAGINSGANMGDDTLYSGTVAAATEGYLLGLPALAFSLCGKRGEHFETAAKVAWELVQTIQARPFNAPLLLNVNVPDIPYAALQGRAVTRLGRRHPATGSVPTTTPRGQTVYWIGAAGEALDASEGTDFYAINQQYVSMTPLRIDLTHRQQISQIQQWLQP